MQLVNPIRAARGKSQSIAIDIMSNINLTLSFYRKLGGIFSSNPVSRWLRLAVEAGQRFGLPNWTHWDLTNICPDDALCATTSTTAVSNVRPSSSFLACVPHVCQRRVGR